MSNMDIQFRKFSPEGLKSFWAESWDIPIPITRSAGSALNEWYPVENFIVAIHEGKPIGASGYTQRDGYVLYGQSIMHPDYKGEGIYSDLGVERDMAVNGPKIAGLVSQDPENFSQSDYESMQERQGFIVNPSEEQIREVFGGEYPEKTIQSFSEFYDNHPTGSWGIKKFDDGFSKSWIYLIKNYYPAGE